MTSTKAKLSRHIVDEASAWFVDFRAGDVAEDARERFDEWLRRSPEHIRAYIEIAKTYVVLPTLDPDYKVDIQQLIEYARLDLGIVPVIPSGRLSADVRPKLESRVRRRRRWLAAACAATCVLAGTLIWATFYRFPTYASGLGERRSIMLADGTTIDLNARSQIRVRFLKRTREVDLLKGQAFFQVVSDRTRPFIVRSGDLRVEDLGTQFDVDRKRNATTVTVVEGRVAVITAPVDSEIPPVAAAQRPREQGKVPVFLTEGEQVVVTGTVMALPRRANLAAATAWLQHRFIFDKSPLSDVVYDFNRYNTRQMVIEDPELDQYHISGVYSSTDPASFLRFLRAQPGIAVTETDGSVRIERK